MESVEVVRAKEEEASEPPVSVLKESVPAAARFRAPSANTVVKVWLPLNSAIAPELTVRTLFARVLELSKRSVPADTVVEPVKVLTPPNSRTPRPCLVSVKVPLDWVRFILRVAVVPVATENTGLTFKVNALEVVPPNTMAEVPTPANATLPAPPRISAL